MRQRRTERIVIRVTPQMFKRAARAALDADRKIADWARIVVESEADRQLAATRLARSFLKSKPGGKR